MDDYPGNPPAPVPPPPAYQPPPPQAPTAAYPPPAPAYGQAPAPAPKKKTWLWVVLGLVILGLLGCCGIAIVGGLLFAPAVEPAQTIDRLNQAALDRDAATFGMLMDDQSVSTDAYEAFIETVMTTEDYAALVAEVGDAEAERLVREELSLEYFVAEFSGLFTLEGMPEGEVPFPEHTVTSTSVENGSAELVLTCVIDGREVEFVLHMTKETVGDEEVWVIKRIENFGEILQDEMAP